MIPNIFISSTIEDLTHLRDALRDVVTDLAYNPVMSEYGDIGYLPTASTEGSCYLTMRECQLAVVIIGKRYGSLSANGLSVTHNEFQIARENKIPVICLVDQEVLSFKKVYDANPKKRAASVFPAMDQPVKTFGFIQDVTDAEVNNGILPFSDVSGARDLFKKQIAHLFGGLLKNRFDPLKAKIQDVLSEIITLRHELLKNKRVDPLPFLHATRFLVDDRNREYRNYVEQICGSLEVAVPILLKCTTFDDFVGKTETKLEVVENVPTIEEVRKTGKMLNYTTRLVGHISEPNAPVATWVIMLGKEVVMNKVAKEMFDRKHEFLRKAGGVS